MKINVRELKQRGNNQDMNQNQIRVIGEGKQAKAKLQKHRMNNMQIVVKEIMKKSFPHLLNLSNRSPIFETDQEDPFLDAIFTEIQIMEKLDHPFILKIQDYFLNKSGNICLVTEYCSNGDLKMYINKKIEKGTQIKEPTIYKIMSQILLGVKQMHDQGLLHRDLGVDNIFLTRNNDIKIGDFGHAFFSTSKPKLEVSKFYHMPPELLKSEGMDDYNYRHDIQQVGIILYNLCMLKPPYAQEVDSQKQLQEMTLSVNPPNIPNYETEEISELLTDTFNKNVLSRAPINKILEKYTFIKEIVDNRIDDIIQQLQFFLRILGDQDLQNLFNQSITKCKTLFDEVSQSYTNISEVNGQKKQFENELNDMKAKLETVMKEKDQMAMEMTKLKKEVEMSQNQINDAEIQVEHFGDSKFDIFDQEIDRKNFKTGAVDLIKFNKPLVQGVHTFKIRLLYQNNYFCIGDQNMHLQWDKDNGHKKVITLGQAQSWNCNVKAKGKTYQKNGDVIIVKVDINKKIVEYKDFKTKEIIATGDLNILGVDAQALQFWISNAGAKFKIVEYNFYNDN